MEKQEMKKEYKSYLDHLTEVILPFYMERAIDKVHGGFYSCFSNDGRKMVSTHKYMWSQGRYIWIFSKLAQMEEFPESRRKEFLELAGKGLDFVLNHGFLEDGRCVFLMDEKGEWLETTPGAGYAGSTFADCYVASGIAEYAKAAKDRSILELAMKKYSHIMEMYRNHTFQTLPFYVPQGMKCHLTAMILCGMQRDYLLALEALGDKRAEEVRACYGTLCREILDHFCQENFLVREMIQEDNAPSRRFLGNYVNIGHTMEGMWFVLDWALKNHDDSAVKKVGRILNATFCLGWDREYGGLYYYRGADGQELSGDILDGQEEKSAAQMKKDQSNKIWWVHTESLYALLLYGISQNDGECLERYRQLKEYTFRTFPNPDPEIGDWIFLRNRDGQPAENEVGGRLPIKDPFHPIRNIVLMIELLKNTGEKA